jgi:Carboxypeptidase regulatory-like domain
MKYAHLAFAILFVISPLGESAQHREAQPAETPVANDPISGNWEGTILIKERKGPLHLKLKLDGDKVTCEDPECILAGSWDGKVLVLRGEKSGHTPNGQEITIASTLTARLQGEKLVGEIEVDFQGSKTQGTWEAGRKAPTSPPSAEQTSANQPELPGKETITRAGANTPQERETSSGPGSAGGKGARIEGRVFRSDNNASSPDIEVELSDENAPKEQKKVARTMTDAKGSYTFTDVKPGKYSLVVTARNLDESTLPCRPSGMLALTRDKWFVSVARTQSGTIVEIILVDKFPVEAGAVVKKNVDLKCGQ